MKLILKGMDLTLIIKSVMLQFFFSFEAWIISVDRHSRLVNNGQGMLNPQPRLLEIHLSNVLGVCFLKNYFK